MSADKDGDGEPIHVWATDLTEEWFHADSDKEPGEDNMQIAGFDIQPQVFFISAGLIILFIALTAWDPTSAGEIFDDAFNFVNENFGWFYILAANLFIIVVLFLALSKYGNIRLGGVDADKEFSDVSWIAMLFSAGMGIGLMFWSVGEPLFHMADPLWGVSGLDYGHVAYEDGVPVADDSLWIIGEQVAAAEIGIAVTYFHWAFHPWAIYGIVGLALAFFAFNRGLPLTFRSVFWPLLGNRIYGWAGHVVDILAIFATLFGLGTSLGLGALQVNRGLEITADEVFGVTVPFGDGAQVAIIAFITLVAVVSVAAGIHRGIRVLSNINVGLMLLLMFSVLILGPTLFLLELIPQSIGYYIQTLPELSFFTEATGIEGSVSPHYADWGDTWTVFYWGWWIAWSPFVGMFIARISRGRTVREFVLGVLIIPVLFSFMFIGILGGAAMDAEIANQDAVEGILADHDGDVQAAIDAGDLTPGEQETLIAGIFTIGEEVAMFEMFEEIALTSILSILAVILVITFFVTSSDSGSLVLGHLSSGGKHSAPRNQRISWALIEGAVAAVLLVAGGLGALQTASIVGGLPLAVILVIMCFSVWKGLKNEYDTLRSDEFEAAVRDLIDEEGLTAEKAGGGVYTHLEEGDGGGGGGPPDDD